MCSPTSTRSLAGSWVVDGAFLRLIGKCLHVGVLEGEEYSEPEECTVHGSVLSPLGNICLHRVLRRMVQTGRDTPASKQSKPSSGSLTTESSEEDDRRVMGVIAKRFERYGLKLRPEKTRPVRFEAARVEISFAGFRRGARGGNASGLLEEPLPPHARTRPLAYATSKVGDLTPKGVYRDQRAAFQTRSMRFPAALGFGSRVTWRFSTVWVAAT